MGTVAPRQLLTPTLLKAARALLRMDQEQLAQATGITRKTIALIETTPPGRVDPRRREILERLRRRMEDELEVVFTFASERTGEGVRLRSPSREDEDG